MNLQAVLFMEDIENEMDIKFNKKEDSIYVTNLDGPLNHLENNWRFKEKNNITEEEALEYLEFNTIGAWVGEKTPMFVSLITMEEIDEM